MCRFAIGLGPKGKSTLYQNLSWDAATISPPPFKKANR